MVGGAAATVSGARELSQVTEIHAHSMSHRHDEVLPEREQPGNPTPTMRVCDGRNSGAGDMSHHGMRTADAGGLSAGGPITPTGSLDRIGGTASLGCAIHCALMPAIVPFLPLLGIAWLADERVEWGLLGTTAVIATAAIGRGYLHHRRRLPAAIVLTGLALVLAGRLGEQAGWFIAPGLMAVGGVTVALGHWRNHRASCQCPCHGAGRGPLSRRARANEG